MKRDDAMPTGRSPRIERRDDAPGSREDQAERPDKPRICDFRATARHIATQLDIEAVMWRMLGKDGRE
ncbi:hypothetical protein GF348_24465 [candidate division KSB3 bacterium]|nr:hypothetical protein [candidate division KSB3 bacterium]